MKNFVSEGDGWTNRRTRVKHSVFPNYRHGGITGDFASLHSHTLWYEVHFNVVTRSKTSSKKKKNTSDRNLFCINLHRHPIFTNVIQKEILDLLTSPF